MSAISCLLPPQHATALVLNAKEERMNPAW
jgi:hypothetical protein